MIPPPSMASAGTLRGLARLRADAMTSRASANARRIALALVIGYNIVGFLDIVSTILAIESGNGEEANPLMRAAMDHLGLGWIVAKLSLQGLITAMVLWFPHIFVMTIFLIAVTTNALIVANNFLIYLGLGG